MIIKNSALNTSLRYSGRILRLSAKINVLFTFIIILICHSIVAQDTYDLSWNKELKWLGGSAAGIGISIPIGKKISPLSSFQIENLDSLSISKFDRISTTLYDKRSQKVSDIILKGPVFILPFSTYIDGNANNEKGNIAALYLETNLVTFGLTALTKVLAKRTRPYAYNRKLGDDLKMKRDTRQSFFSGHTSMTAANTFLTARILADTNPNSDWIPFYWISAATIPAVMGYLRIKGGKHFPTDVIVGYVVGALAGILVPAFHK